MDRFRAFITIYFFLPSSSYIKILFFGESYIPINTIIIKNEEIIENQNKENENEINIKNEDDNEIMKK